MATALLVIGSMFAMVALIYLISWVVRLFRDGETPSIDPTDIF